jgi:hypothetical protein
MRERRFRVVPKNVNAPAPTHRNPPITNGVIVKTAPVISAAKPPQNRLTDKTRTIVLHIISNTICHDYIVFEAFIFYI